MGKSSVRECLFRLDQRRKQILRPGFLALGLTLGQGQPRILKYLYEKEPRSQTELAGLCGMDVTTMSRTLDRLAAAGLVERKINEACRRSCHIVLTPDGKVTAGKVCGCFEQLDEKLCSGMTEEEINSLVASLERLLKNLETKET